MARSYKRDSRGRFAGGGGGSSGGKRGGGSGGPKRNKSRVTTTGTFVTRQRGKLAQQKRTKAFSSKATTGRAAKEAWKKASGAARKVAKATGQAGNSLFSQGGKRTLPNGRYVPGGTKSVPPPPSGGGRKKRSSADKSPAARAERVVRRMVAVGSGRSGAKLKKSRETQARAHTFLKFMSGTPAYSRGSRKGTPKSNQQRMRELWGNLSNKKKVAEYGQLLARVARANGYSR